jgi:tryptophanyl-tRNA synthetase
MARDIAQRFNHTYGADILKLPEPHILDEVAVVPGTDGRKMSKSYDNVIRMFWPEKQIKKAVMSVVTDSTSVEDPKDTDAPIFQLWSLFAEEADREETFERARKGGLGYGELKKDLLKRLLEYFAPMREKREDLARRPDDVEDILADGAQRARKLGAPVVAAAREAAGLGPGR